MSWSGPVAIVVLLAILVFSYRQVIDAYPGGGGAYAVSLDNFGPRVSLVAAAALTSAFPAFSPATVPICLAVLAVITLLNLRGLGYAARAFLLPTMVFIVGLLAILAIGLLHPLALHAAPLSRSLLPARAMEPVGLLLLLKAFSAGCNALTGVEAIANGVPLFKPPRVRRAKRTELLLGVILGAMLLGVATLAGRWRVAPSSGQTVLSQVMTIAVGRDWAYYATALAIPREPQRPRRGRHCCGRRRIPGDEVHRGRLGCGAGVARVHHAVHQDPPLLRPGRARAQAKASRGRYQPGGCARP